jgi:hypothetical protein
VGAAATAIAIPDRLSGSLFVIPGGTPQFARRTALLGSNSWRTRKPHLRESRFRTEFRHESCEFHKHRERRRRGRENFARILEFWTSPRPAALPWMRLRPVFRHLRRGELRESRFRTDFTHGPARIRFLIEIGTGAGMARKWGAKKMSKKDRGRPGGGQRRQKSRFRDGSAPLFCDFRRDTTIRQANSASGNPIRGGPGKHIDSCRTVFI